MARKRIKFNEDLARFTPRQLEAVAALATGLIKYLLYGGALGGGKSYFLRWYCVRRLIELAKLGFPYATAMLACEDYPSLKDRQLSKIASEFPPWLGVLREDHKVYGRCFIITEHMGGGVICFRNLDDPSKYQCYHPETDILTRNRGFVPISDVKKGEYVASLNPETRKAEYQKVSKTHIYDFDGDMISTPGNKAHLAFCVTPNHNMIGRTRRKKQLEFTKAENLPGTFLIPRSGKWDGKKPSFIKIKKAILGRQKKGTSFEIEIFLKFLGWYLSEGNLGNRKRYEIRISQKKALGRERIKKVLNEFPYIFYEDDKGFRIYGKALFKYLERFGVAYEKYIPREILSYHPDLLKILFNSLMAGDGHKYGETRWVFATTSPRLVDDVSELAIRIGLVPTIIPHFNYKKGRYRNARPYWHISISKRGDTKLTETKKIPYKGNVYCVTVKPYHTVLIRYNNRVMWCGQSAEFALIAIDELTKNVYDVFTFLRTRLRWPGLEDILCQFVAGTNPGGVGHGWVKQLWMSKVFPEEWIRPVDRTGQFAYIPSKATDNPHLTASYWSMLDTLPEALRKPFRDGNWDVFVGQAFPELSQEIHVLPDDTPIPEGSPIYMTFDWGFGKPFSLGWWWVDADGRVYRFYEWYGWDGTPDQGLRMTDSDIAEGIKSREKVRSLNSEMLIRLAGPDCFQKRPDYKGGGQGPPTSEVFAGKGLYLGVGDPSRELKIRAFRERLRVRPEDGKPMLYVYKRCKQFIRTIPDLVMDQSNIEDVDTTGEDHVYDEVCHICMARPITLVEKPPDKQTRAQKDFDHVEGKDENLRAVNIN